MTCSDGCATRIMCLREEILLPGHGVKAVMPGIEDLLPRWSRATTSFLAC